MFGQDILILLFMLFASFNCASITTFNNDDHHHHVEFLSNRTYQELYLRQYFLNLLNHSQPALIQTHHLIPQLEQIQYRRRRRALSSIPLSPIPSNNCSMKNTNEMQSIFTWFHSIESSSSIELIYHLNSKSSSIPVRIAVKPSEDSTEFLSMMTHLQYDSTRDLYSIDLSDYLRPYYDRKLHLEILLFDQICSQSYGYLIISSNSISLTEPQSSTQCRLKHLPIRFDQLGLANLIIRPQRYVFTYCEGSCSNPSSFRTYLQNILSKQHSNIPSLTCHPSAYENDYFLLRQIDGHMAIYSIENALVKQCTCL